MKKVSNILWGLAFIIVGIIFALNALEIIDINVFFEGWWTLFIIVPCFINLFKEESKTGNIVGLIVGIMLMFACRGVFSFDIVWKLLVPTILVIVGLSFIFKDLFNKELKDKINKLNKKTKGEYSAIFGGQKVSKSGEKFSGTEINAIFGGVELDLRNALIDSDIVINANAIFGGITLLVPKDAKVKVEAMPIFGGVGDERNSEKTSEYTIYVKSLCIFGGVEINDRND